MSSLLFDTAARLIGSQSFTARTAGVGVVGVVLLLGLLVESELLRALGGARARRRARTLMTAIAPLLLTFGLIIGTRIGHLV